MYIAQSLFYVRKAESKVEKYIGVCSFNVSSCFNFLVFSSPSLYRSELFNFNKFQLKTFKNPNKYLHQKWIKTITSNME